MEQPHPANIPLPKPCWGCGAMIDPQDRYCRHCGRGQGENVSWYYRHWGIILLAVLGLGPFTLYFLWRSPVITRNAKLIYTAAILLLTWYMLFAAYRVWDLYQALFAPVPGY